MLNKIITNIFILSILAFIHGCASEQKIPNSESPLACGDLFSIYADKPINLKYKGCTEFSAQQTLLEATYFVTNDNADEVEKLLVENYGLIDSCDYHHAMSTNEISLQPEKLLEINPYYYLFITINHYDSEALAYSGCKRKRNKQFMVVVKILEV